MTSKNNIKKVTSNKSKRHFTITMEDGTKYRTTPMSKFEFNNSLYNTPNDWKYFLRSDEYYRL